MSLVDQRYAFLSTLFGMGVRTVAALATCEFGFGAGMNHLQQEGWCHHRLLLIFSWSVKLVLTPLLFTNVIEQCIPGTGSLEPFIAVA